MKKVKTKCEMCEEMRVCHDGYCKACLEQLDKLISISYLLAQGFILFTPWQIGMNEIKKYQAKMENEDKQ